ncbi:hypothetical protein [Nostoc sp. C110]
MFLANQSRRIGGNTLGLSTSFLSLRPLRPTLREAAPRLCGSLKN